MKIEKKYIDTLIPKKFQEVQTDFRESEIQTVPYAPNIYIDESRPLPDIVKHLSDIYLSNSDNFDKDYIKLFLKRIKDDEIEQKKLSNLLKLTNTYSKSFHSKISLDSCKKIEKQRSNSKSSKKQLSNSTSSKKQLSNSTSSKKQSEIYHTPPICCTYYSVEKEKSNFDKLLNQNKFFWNKSKKESKNLKKTTFLSIENYIDKEISNSDYSNKLIKGIKSDYTNEEIIKNILSLPTPPPGLNFSHEDEQKYKEAKNEPFIKLTSNSLNNKRYDLNERKWSQENEKADNKKSERLLENKIFINGMEKIFERKQKFEFDLHKKRVRLYRFLLLQNIIDKSRNLKQIIGKKQSKFSKSYFIDGMTKKWFIEGYNTVDINMGKENQWRRISQQIYHELAYSNSKRSQRELCLGGVKRGCLGEKYSNNFNIPGIYENKKYSPYSKQFNSSKFIDDKILKSIVEQTVPKIAYNLNKNNSTLKDKEISKLDYSKNTYFESESDLDLNNNQNKINDKINISFNSQQSFYKANISSNTKNTNLKTSKEISSFNDSSKIDTIISSNQQIKMGGSFTAMRAEDKKSIQLLNWKEALKSTFTKKFEKTLSDLDLTKQVEKELPSHEILDIKESSRSKETNAIEFDRKRYQNINLIKGLLNGRKMQIEMLKGTLQFKYLIDELQLTEEIKKESNNTNLTSNAWEKDFLDSSLEQGNIEDICGIIISKALEELSLALQRKEELAKIENFIEYAKVERELREAQELGRRQAVVNLRHRNEQAFSHISKCFHQSVDGLFSFVIPNAIEISSKYEVFCKEKIRNGELKTDVNTYEQNNCKDEEIIDSLLFHFLLPHVQKQLLEQKLQHKKDTYEEIVKCTLQKSVESVKQLLEKSNNNNK